MLGIILFQTAHSPSALVRLCARLAHSDPLSEYHARSPAHVFREDASQPFNKIYLEFCMKNKNDEEIEEETIKAEEEHEKRRQAKRKKRMPQSGKSVFVLKDIIKKKSEEESDNKKS